MATEQGIRVRIDNESSILRDN